MLFVEYFQPKLSISSAGIVSKELKLSESNNLHFSLFCKINPDTVDVELYVSGQKKLLVKARRGQSPVQRFVACGVLDARILCFLSSDEF